MDQILEQLKKIIFDVMSPDVKEAQIIPEAKFVDDLGADSLDRIAIMMAVEEWFAIEIPDIDSDGLETVGQATEYISRRLAEEKRAERSSVVSAGVTVDFQI